MNVLTNLSKVLGTAARATGTVFPIAAPIGHAAGVLFSLFGKALSVAAKTPLLDAGVAIIPGLAGQSRVGNNAEILRLRDGLAGLSATERRGRFLEQYWFLKSNFETEDAGWKFWRYFRKDKLADTAADVVFEGDNDLVFDTDSMTDLSDQLSLASLGAGFLRNHVKEFEKGDGVHHCSYFRQAGTVDLVRRAFGLGR